jgi:nucleoside-diphosphate-sugar epimerase
VKGIFVFGLGYSAQVFARRATGFAVAGTTRTRERAARLREGGINAFVFDGQTYESGILEALSRASILLASAPPSETGDLALSAFAERIAAAPFERVIYLSTVGVYGGADGDWIDESALTLGDSPRAHWRILAESQWRNFSRRHGIPLDTLRLAGIYGPGRNPLVRLKEGAQRRIIKPGQVFNRIHVDDVAGVALKLIEAGGPGGVWNVADREPAPPQDVIVFAARLMGIEPPQEELFESADLSPMARSFYADNRRISTEKLRRELGYAWSYPTYREGLTACYEAGDGEL